jgi:hypothetical protein
MSFQLVLDSCDNNSFVYFSLTVRFVSMWDNIDSFTLARFSETFLVNPELLLLLKKVSQGEVQVTDGSKNCESRAEDRGKRP